MSDILKARSKLDFLSEGRTQIMKTQRAITRFVLLFAVLLIAGWSCGQPATPAATGPVTSRPDSITDAGIPTSDSSVTPTPPEGWTVYEGQQVPVSFWLPQGWDAVELGDAVLVSDTEFPDPLPPEIYDAAIVIGLDSETNENVYSKLQKFDPSARIETVVVNQSLTVKISHHVTEPVGDHILFRFPNDTSFLEVGSDASWDGTSELTAILNSIVLRRAE